MSRKSENLFTYTSRDHPTKKEKPIMKLTAEQKGAIKSQFFETVLDPEKRSRILAIAYGFAKENGEDGDLESMVLYLMDEKNESKIDDLFDEYGISAADNFEYEYHTNSQHLTESTTDKTSFADRCDNEAASLGRMAWQINHVLDIIDQEGASCNVDHQSGVYQTIIEELNELLSTALDEIQMTQAALVVPDILRKPQS